MDALPMVLSVVALLVSIAAFWRGGRPGPRGEQGPPGATGATGPRGEQGPTAVKAEPAVADEAPAAVPDAFVREAIAEHAAYERDHVERQAKRVATKGPHVSHLEHGEYTPQQRLTAVSQRVLRRCHASGIKVVEAQVRAACAKALESGDA